MKVLVNDFSGHPFQIQLSRWLAKKGYNVLHTYCSSVLTPHGSLKKQNHDPDQFNVKTITLGRDFQKYRLASRWIQERALGRKIVNIADQFDPDAIVSANMPLGGQGLLLKYAHRKRVPFVFWVQDLYGVGARSVLRKRIPLFGGMLGRALGLYEQTLLARSAHVVAITEDFLSYLPKDVRQNRTTVIENWAPLDELPVLPKRNDWSLEHGLADKTCLVYAGTLGLKHNPALLLELAKAFQPQPDVRVVVISEGAGLEYLINQRQAHNLTNLILLGFQPFDCMPQVHASADVLLAILEKEAGVFAVPSKVLTYLCAKRPLLLAVPSANLAARVVERSRSGLVVEPDDVSGFVRAAQHLVQEPGLRESLAENGRCYAEQTFNIRSITDRFEEILGRVVREVKR